MADIFPKYINIPNNIFYIILRNDDIYNFFLKFILYGYKEHVLHYLPSCETKSIR